VTERPPLCKICNSSHWLKDPHQWPKQSPAMDAGATGSSSSAIQELSTSLAPVAELSTTPLPPRRRAPNGTFNRQAYMRAYRATRKAEKGKQNEH
jgi:hypothetical protein